jgi:hypothetical protein
VPFAPAVVLWNGAPVMLSRFHHGLQRWIGLDLQILSGCQDCCLVAVLPGAGGAGGGAGPLDGGGGAGPLPGGGGGVLRDGAEELAAGLEDEEADEAAGALEDERTDVAEDERAEVIEGAAELTELDGPPMLMLAERSRGEEFFP